MTMCAVTIRSLRPGTFEQFRKEWEPRPWLPHITRVVVSRNQQDPDQVLTASFLDLSIEQLEVLRDDPSLLEAEERRLARIAQYEEAFIYKGLFEIVEDLDPPTSSEKSLIGTAPAADAMSGPG